MCSMVIVIIRTQKFDIQFLDILFGSYWFRGTNNNKRNQSISVQKTVNATRF